MREYANLGLDRHLLRVDYGKTHPLEQRLDGEFVHETAARYARPGQVYALGRADVRSVAQAGQRMEDFPRRRVNPASAPHRQVGEQNRFAMDRPVDGGDRIDIDPKPSKERRIRPAHRNRCRDADGDSGAPQGPQTR